MDAVGTKKKDSYHTPRPASVTGWVMIVLAVSFGLCAGYLDIAILVFKKYYWNSEGYFRNAERFSLDGAAGPCVS